MLKNTKYDKCRKKYEGKKISGFDKWEGFVRNINSENSTRASNATIEELAKLLYENYEGKSFSTSDIDIIIDALYVKCSSRIERSLVSKVVKYYELYINKNESLSVNDSVIRAILPYYLKYYKISEYCENSKYPTDEKMQYIDLHKMMNAISEKAGISIHKIDQIIWYCYKSDDVRRAVAKAYYFSAEEKK